MALGRLAGRSKLVAMGLVWILPPAPMALALPGAVQFEESLTRAAFLVSLAKFAEWPGPAGEVLVIGVVGETPVAAALERLLQAPGPGRAMVTRRFRTPAEVQGCHLLYFPASEERTLPTLRAKLTGQGVLTVGETSFFIGYGGAVQVFNEEGRLRFVVNRAAADSARVHITAQVLRLAKQVVNQP